MNPFTNASRLDNNHFHGPFLITPQLLLFKATGSGLLIQMWGGKSGCARDEFVNS